jgi:hypothetical protein
MVKRGHTEPKKDIKSIYWCTYTVPCYYRMHLFYISSIVTFFSFYSLPLLVWGRKENMNENNIVLVHGSQRWHFVNNPIVLHNYCYNSLLVMMWNLTRWTLIPIWYPEQRSGVTKSGKSPDFLFKLMRGWESYIFKLLLLALNNKDFRIL